MKSASDELKAMLGVSQVRSHGACTRRDGAETNAARRKLGCVVSYTAQPIGHACALSTQFVRQQSEHGDTAQTVSMAELSYLKAPIGINPEVRWSCGYNSLARMCLLIMVSLALRRRASTCR
jgi:hypothetical protein